MKYEVKRSATKSEVRPWDVWFGNECISPGFSSHSAASIEAEVLEGLDKLRERKRQIDIQTVVK